MILRIILSDGKFFIQSMLATQLNHFVEDKHLDKNVVVKLTGFVTNAVQGRKCVILPLAISKRYLSWPQMLTQRSGSSSSSTSRCKTGVAKRLGTPQTWSSRLGLPQQLRLRLRRQHPLPAREVRPPVQEEEREVPRPVDRPRGRETKIWALCILSKG